MSYEHYSIHAVTCTVSLECFAGETLCGSRIFDRPFCQGSVCHYQFSFVVIFLPSLMLACTYGTIIDTELIVNINYGLTKSPSCVRETSLIQSSWPDKLITRVNCTTEHCH